MPLILRRKRGESILIGNDIKITVTRCKNTHTVLECEAPSDVKIMREELYEEIKKLAICNSTAKSAIHTLTGE